MKKTATKLINVFSDQCNPEQVNKNKNTALIRAYQSPSQLLDVNHFKQKNETTRYLGFHDKVAVSSDAKKKIDKIISEDKKKLWSRQN